MTRLSRSRHWATVLSGFSLFVGAGLISVLSVSAFAQTVRWLVDVPDAIGSLSTVWVSNESAKLAGSAPTVLATRGEVSQPAKVEVNTALASAGATVARGVPSAPAAPSKPGQTLEQSELPSASLSVFTWRQRRAAAPRCDDVYAYIISDFVAGPSAIASVAYGKRSRARSKRVGARVGPWTIIDIGHNHLASSPSVWLSNADGEVCQAKVFDGNPHRKKQYKKNSYKKKKKKKRKRKKRRR